MVNYLLKADPVVVNASGPSFRVCAEEIFGCVVQFQSRRDFSPVPYMLLCRAIELKLKSHHLETMTQPEVKRFQHDLVAAYNALPAALRLLSLVEEQLLQQASAIYIDEKGFDYVSPKDMLTGYSRFPDLQALTDLTRKLLAQLCPP